MSEAFSPGAVILRWWVVPAVTQREGHVDRPLPLGPPGARIERTSGFVRLFREDPGFVAAQLTGVCEQNPEQSPSETAAPVR